MKIKNNGAILWLPSGMVPAGVSEMDKAKWERCKELPKVKAALADGRLEVVGAEKSAKTAPEKVEETEDKPAPKTGRRSRR